jgi:hypothetical protein
VLNGLLNVFKYKRNVIKRLVAWNKYLVNCFLPLLLERLNAPPTFFGACHHFSSSAGGIDCELKLQPGK